MLVLDTNHVVELGYDSPPGQRLLRRLDGDPRQQATTVVCAEEQIRGWMAELHRVTDPHRQIPLYHRLQDRIEFYADWLVLPWDEDAADLFVRFRQQRIRIGTQDLKIACIALAHSATILTRNLSDFQQVPNLVVENWLD